MGVHHIALATNDIVATHRFYTDAMGFTLAKSVVAPTPEGGWAKHLFYDTGGGGMIAFWDLHVDSLDVPDASMSRSLGLPEWINHLAFDASTDELWDAGFKRWSDHGLDIFEVDHGFCRSIYTTDPNGTMVEWCQDLETLGDQDAARALATVSMTDPDVFDPLPEHTVFHPGDHSLTPDWSAA